MHFSFQSIAHYHQQVKAGQVSIQQAVAYYLEKIKAQAHLNALVQVFEEEAMTLAAAQDKQLADGHAMLALQGVVITIKDVLCYKGHPVSAGSKMLQYFHSLYSATAVERLVEAGAIIIGTANCDEFAMGSSNENSAYGPVLNAANTQHVPGGSSGGSAVSVQAGMCMAAIGSDTGGSVRQPADFCGVVGLKPGYGRISRWGLIAYASSFDCIGILANQVADVAAVYQVIAGPDGKDSTALPQKPPAITPYQPTGKKYRFAWLKPTLGHPANDPIIDEAIFQTLGQLQQAGHTVTALPFDLLEYIVPAYYVLTTAEASSNLGRFDGIRFGHTASLPPDDLTAFYKRNRSEGFGKEVQRRIMLGSFVLSAGYFDAYFTKAQQVRRLLVDAIAHIFNEFDAIIMPVSPTTAPALGAGQKDPVGTYMADIYTVFANLTGVPTMALPLYQHPNGLPFGLQVLTNQGDEVLLHAISSYLEAGFSTKTAAHQ